MKKLFVSILIFQFAFTSNAQSVSNEMPIGTIVAWSGNRAILPKGWLVCDGSQISKDNFPKLCNVLGNLWGPTDADVSVARLFYLPDLRGIFLRGVNEGRNDQYADVDAEGREYKTSNKPSNFQSNQVGSYQKDAVKKHTHTITVNDDGTPPNGSYNITGYGKHPGPSVESKPNSEGNESRPKNAYIYWIIKAE